jgi:hypothetical protein
MGEVNKAYLPVRQKTFLLKLPLELWQAAKNISTNKDISLHDYILSAIAEKVERDTT